MILAILIFFFPTLFGEGYESIKTLASKNPNILLDNTMLEPFKSSEWVLLVFIGVTMLLKAFATGLTLGSGGNGGNFAPSLFVGSYLGFFVAKTVNLLNFTLPSGDCEFYHCGHVRNLEWFVSRTINSYFSYR